MVGGMTADDNGSGGDGMPRYFGDQQAQMRRVAQEERQVVTRGPLRLFLVFLGLFILGLLLPIVMLGILG